MECACIVLFGALVVVRFLVVHGRDVRRLIDSEALARKLTKDARRIDASRIADVEDGSYVRVIGEVKRHADSVTAPMSKRACAHWHLEVSVFEWAPGGRKRMRTLCEQSSGQPFVLTDSSGECLVDPDFATIRVSERRLRRAMGAHELPHNYRAYLVGAGVDVESLERKELVIQESIVPFGARVAVAGVPRMVRRAQLEHGYREPQPAWPCLASGEVTLLISNHAKLLRLRK